MKMYSRNIRNLKELEQEKRRLLQERKQLEQEELFSVDSMMSSILKAKDDKTNSISTASEQGNLLSMSGPIASMVLDIVKDRILNKMDSGNTSSFANNPLMQKGGNILKGAAKELVGGYLKWKAIELTYKGVTLIVKRQKRKKAERLAKEEGQQL
jgi:hypothetical protein